jgi:hypothetical protein
MTIAISGSRNVPTRIGKIPPSRPMSRGAEKRNSRLTPGNPLPRTNRMMNNSTATVRSVAAPRMATARAWVILGGILIAP